MQECYCNGHDLLDEDILRYLLSSVYSPPYDLLRTISKYHKNIHDVLLLFAIVKHDCCLLSSDNNNRFISSDRAVFKTRTTLLFVLKISVKAFLVCTYFPNL